MSKSDHSRGIIEGKTYCRKTRVLLKRRRPCVPTQATGYFCFPVSNPQSSVQNNQLISKGDLRTITRAVKFEAKSFKAKVSQIGFREYEEILRHRVIRTQEKMIIKSSIPKCLTILSLV
jgi:hypothetical protein